MDRKKEAIDFDMYDTMVVCGLCLGDGLDKTGRSKNGWTGKKATPFCVRCGGYGSIPRSCDNGGGLTNRDEEQLKIEEGVSCGWFRC